MKNKKQLIQAEKKVSKALTVFSQAVTEVEQAQELLTKGIEQDSMSVTSIKNQIADLRSKIVQLEKDKAEKGERFKVNQQLIEKLKEFQA